MVELRTFVCGHKAFLVTFKTSAQLRQHAYSVKPLRIPYKDSVVSTNIQDRRRRWKGSRERKMVGRKGRDLWWGRGRRGRGRWWGMRWGRGGEAAG